MQSRAQVEQRSPRRRRRFMSASTRHAICRLNDGPPVVHVFSGGTEGFNYVKKLACIILEMRGAACVRQLDRRRGGDEERS